MTIRTKSLFSKKIKCLHCGSPYKYKKERNTPKYICSQYDLAQKCIRIPIQESFMIELIEKRLQKKVDRYVVEKYIEAIVVEDTNLVEIFIYGQESILLSKRYLRY